MLGRLDHPGIAKIYESGTQTDTDDAQPYFAMELIQGSWLLDHREQHERRSRGRVAPMALVCDAIEHAHQKRAIHHDLEPSNIMVIESGHPQVLDVGVACAGDINLQATLRTSTGRIVGAAPHMSPEQINSDVHAPDVRSDVYSLGVVLYKMLSGQRPCELDGRTEFEVARVVRQDQPTRLGILRLGLRG
ncbi:MAG: serine/threonine-protein kinase, partial [Planctomycetota bacterium]